MKLYMNAKTIYYIYCGVGSLLFSLVFTSIAVYYIDTINLNPLQLVLIGTTLETVCFLFEIPTGIIADMYSRKLSVIIGVLLIGLGFLIEGLFPLFIIVLLAQFLWGVGATFTSGAESAWIADEIDEDDLDKTYLKGAQIGQLFAFFGIVLSIILANIVLNLPIILGGSLFIVLALFLYLFMPENNFKSTIPDDLHIFKKFTHSFTNGIKIVKNSKTLRLIIIITFIIGLSSEGFDRLWQAYFINSFSFPSFINLKPVTWFGIITSISMLLSIISTHFIINKLNKNGKLENVTMLIIINFLLVISFIIFGLIGNFYLAALTYFSIYIFRTVNRPIYSAWINKQIKSDLRATVLSMNQQFDALGQIIGGPIMGFIATNFTIAITMISTGLILVPILPLLNLIKKNNRIIKNNKVA